MEKWVLKYLMTLIIWVTVIVLSVVNLLVQTTKPNFHIFVASKAPWLDINDQLKQFKQGPVK